MGDAEELLAHYLKARQNQAGRSVPCEGVGCPHCGNGEVVLKNYYAPALLNFPGNVVGGKPVWERVVYYVPQGAVSGFGPGIQRGRLFKVWRWMVGSVSQLRSRYSAPVLLAEPTFDVRPVLEHFFLPSPASKAALEAVFSTLPPNITPPVLNLVRDNSPKPSEADLEQLRKAARPGDNPVSPKVDPAKLKEVEDAIKFGGKSITERKANGTYSPKTNGQKNEGGAE